MTSHMGKSGDKTRENLESICQSRSLPENLVQRAEMVLLASEGWPFQAIASTLEISPSTAKKWYARFEDQGLKGIGLELSEGEESASPNSVDPDHTISFLLDLRSVKDQFKDAELDQSSGKLGEELAVLEDNLVDHLVAQRKHRDGVGLLTVAVVGDFNSGKSTFINGLLGRDLCPVGEEPTTSSVTHFIHGDKESIEQQLPNGKRRPVKKSEYTSLVRHSKMGDRVPYVFHISVNAPILEHIRLVDTPGFNAPPPNSYDTKVTEDAITGADALFVLSDAHKGNPTKSLLTRLDQFQKSTEDEPPLPVFLLLNKAEGLPPTQRVEVKRVCETRHGDRFREIALICASQLCDSEDAGPLNVLETVTGRIREAFMQRDQLEASISGKVVPGEETGIYRMDIDGNVFETSTVSDSGMASVVQLSDMMRSVSAERHALLESQFQRKTTQIRKTSENILTELENALKKELGNSDGVEDETEDIKSKALEAIEKSKFDILDQVEEITNEAIEKLVVKNQRKKEGWVFDSTIFRVDIRLDRVLKQIDDRNRWNRISVMNKNLVSFLEDLIGFTFEPGFGVLHKELRKECLKTVRSFQKGVEKSAREGGWQPVKKGIFRMEYEDEEVRDEEHDQISDRVSFLGPQLNLKLTHFVQFEIDRLQEAVISSVEKNLSREKEKADELARLQQRITELKEHTI